MFKRKRQSFLQKIEASLPDQMSLPDEFCDFYRWIEMVGGLGNYADGKQYAVVDPIVHGPRYLSSVEFHEIFHDNYWTGCWDENEMKRLATFARTGGDGSSAAFWLDDQGNQHIVHLGSGSGSTMVGIWVKSPLDFLRLLAIGYDELCWPENSKKAPEDLMDAGEEFCPPINLREWLVNKYDVIVPKTASEVINEMSEIGEQSNDPFCNWLDTLNPP